MTVRERDARLAFLLPVVFAVRHFVHGAGTPFGLLLVALPGDRWKRRRRGRNSRAVPK
jgi:hypothetical protein